MQWLECLQQASGALQASTAPCRSGRSHVDFFQTPLRLGDEPGTASETRARSWRY